MNNIVSFIVVILLIFNVAMAFFIAAIIDKIDKLTDKITGIGTETAALGKSIKELDISATLAKQCGDESIKQSRRAIDMSKAAIEAGNDAREKSAKALERGTGARDAVNRFADEINRYTRGTFGTTDPGEFSRVKTAAYSTQNKAKELENAVRILYHRVGAKYPSNSTQNGLIGIHTADDVRAMNMQRRN